MDHFPARLARSEAATQQNARVLSRTRHSYTPPCDCALCGVPTRTTLSRYREIALPVRLHRALCRICRVV
eukprot:5158530-Prymnesium_polylepis.1